MKLLFSILFLFSFSCSEIKKGNDKLSNQVDVITQDTISFDGIWAIDDSSNALIVIIGDTLRYVEHESRMAFRVVGDTMIPSYYDDGAVSIILKHTKDSLILKHQDNSIERLYNRGKYKKNLY